MKETKNNLMKAFAGESQARNRYTIWAKVAKKDGFSQIAEIFTQTAEHEKTHAKMFYEALVENFGGGAIEITATFPAHISDTAANLKAAAEGEHEEQASIYPKFAEVAEAEGYKTIAELFRNIAVVEKYHEERYAKLSATLNAGTLVKKETDKTWQCQECGFLFIGKEAPNTCPVCTHDKNHFTILSEEF